MRHHSPVGLDMVHFSLNKTWTHYSKHDVINCSATCKSSEALLYLLCALKKYGN